MAISTRIPSDFALTHRKQSTATTPQQVLDVFRESEIKDSVLMGPHGYVGYQPEPRAAQVVEILIGNSFARHAAKNLRPSLPRRAATSGGRKQVKGKETAAVFIGTK